MRTIFLSSLIMVQLRCSYVTARFDFLLSYCIAQCSSDNASMSHFLPFLWDTVHAKVPFGAFPTNINRTTNQARLLRCPQVGFARLLKIASRSSLLYFCLIIRWIFFSFNNGKEVNILILNVICTFSKSSAFVVQSNSLNNFWPT